MKMYLLLCGLLLFIHLLLILVGHVVDNKEEESSTLNLKIICIKPPVKLTPGFERFDNCASKIRVLDSKIGGHTLDLNSNIGASNGRRIWNKCGTEWSLCVVGREQCGVVIWYVIGEEVVW
jgi:hypothetical protein